MHCGLTWQVGISSVFHRPSQSLSTALTASKSPAVRETPKESMSAQTAWLIPNPWSTMALISQTPRLQNGGKLFDLPISSPIVRQLNGVRWTKRIPRLGFITDDLVPTRFPGPWSQRETFNTNYVLRCNQKFWRLTGRSEIRRPLCIWRVRIDHHRMNITETRQVSCCRLSRWSLAAQTSNDDRVGIMTIVTTTLDATHQWRQIWHHDNSQVSVLTLKSVLGYRVAFGSTKLTKCRFRSDPPAPGLILGLHPANERRRYKVTPPLIGWAQT